MVNSMLDIDPIFHDIMAIFRHVLFNIYLYKFWVMNEKFITTQTYLVCSILISDLISKSKISLKVHWYSTCILQLIDFNKTWRLNVVEVIGSCVLSRFSHYSHPKFNLPISIPLYKCTRNILPLSDSIQKLRI